MNAIIARNTDLPIRATRHFMGFHSRQKKNKQTNKIKQCIQWCLPCLPAALGPPGAQWLCSLMPVSLLCPHIPKGCWFCDNEKIGRGMPQIECKVGRKSICS